MDQIAYIVVNRDDYYEFYQNEFWEAQWTYMVLRSRSDMPTTLLARNVTARGDLKRTWFEFTVIDFI